MVLYFYCARISGPRRDAISQGSVEIKTAIDSDDMLDRVIEVINRDIVKNMKLGSEDEIVITSLSRLN